jgi:hypothetical protein
MWLVSLLGFASATATPARAAAPRDRIAVQPTEGDGAPALRQQVAGLLRGRGFRVTTRIPRAAGTAQYFTWAREHDVAAFLVSEVVTRGRSQRVTFVIWSGNDGAVVGRWSLFAPTRKLGRAIAKSFWKRLGPAIERAHGPPSTKPLGPAPPMRIDAGSAHDEGVVGSRVTRGK